MTFDLQKASMWKRLSAALFDGILVVIAIVGAALLLSAVTGYDGYSDTVSDSFAAYEQSYGVTFEMTQEQYDAMSDAERALYNEAYEALCQDEKAMYAYNMLINLTLLIVSISTLLGYLVLEFAVPLFFGNGQTLGKKIFGICLMRTDGIRVSAPLLFIRTVLGKYTLETMIPALIVVMILFNMIGLTGTIVLGLIVLVEIAVIIATETNSLIHDLLAKTVVVDYMSQRIFNDERELIEYKERCHAERVARQKN